MWTLRETGSQNRDLGHQLVAGPNCGSAIFTFCSGFFEELGISLVEFEDEFPEEGVGPGEPIAREFCRIVLVETLVHEAGSGVRALQPRETLALLVIVAGRESADDDSHRPDHVLTNMRAADPLCCGAAEEVGIGFAEHEAAGGEIVGIAL